MNRVNHINWLQMQGTTNTDMRTLEELAAESDMAHDAVCLTVSQVLDTQDPSYDALEGSQFPLRIRFDTEGLSILAPYLYSEAPGAPAVVRSDLKWEELTGFELEQLVHLALGLQKQHHTLAEVHMDQAVAAQARLTGYSVRVRVKKPKNEATAEETVVVWDNDAPEGERKIRDRFGDRLVSLKLLGPMESL